MAHARYYVKSDTKPSPALPSLARQRVTLAPLVGPSYQSECSTFHRALQLFNVRRGTFLTFDELTQHQQVIVRQLAKQLDKEDHPCQKQS
jgi:hypothetical protein